MSKHLASKLKLQIISKYFDSKTSLEMLAKEYNIPKSTISKL